MKKKDRKRFIGRISDASGIAQYALQEKMADEQVNQAVQHLEILKLIKSANDYNRYCQGKKTEEANNKLKAFLNPENSEIVSAGKWLLNALSKNDEDRKNALLEKELVHKEDYNATASGLRETISAMSDDSQSVVQQSAENIQQLQNTIDTLRRQQSGIKQYILNNYGNSEWKHMSRYFDNEDMN
ncbi:MAG: hypothetical protein SAJ72_02825 [Jaaginema sp. PMC 1080.18]|nr:hypothetical protein [Jaaginema sp. PMC 1080.18]MEC4864469.1 hypothetical protein [Jaaginema sp. PMC 1078.18]